MVAAEAAADSAEAEAVAATGEVAVEVIRFLNIFYKKY